MTEEKGVVVIQSAIRNQMAFQTLYARRRHRRHWWQWRILTVAVQVERNWCQTQLETIEAEAEVVEA
jgi:hypothetical protein